MNKKICFITAVNDEVIYEECLFYIKNLNIPNNFVIETIGIRNASCMTNAYNNACSQTDAKYKVYIHQDTFIINKEFINDILKIFKDKTIGMIGICGAKDIPENGVWWNSNNKIGKVYDNHTGKMKLFEFNEVNKKYEKVQAIDGLIMITQYDIAWSEKIFDGWHYYDISQSFEYINKGYDVVVPQQNKPWCIHECGIVNVSNGFDKYRERFISSYLL